MRVKRLGVAVVALLALGGSAAHAAGFDRAGRAFTFGSQPSDRTLLALSHHPTSLLQVARSERTGRLLRRHGAELISGRLGVWRVPSGAAQALAPRLSRAGLLRVVEPERPLNFDGHLDGGDPLLPQEWWIAAVGADRVEPPAPGRPATVVDSGLDVSHEEFAGRPNTTVLNNQSLSGSIEFHGTAVSSIVGAPTNGLGLVGVYPQAALQSWDASPNGELTNGDEIEGILTAASRGPTVINLSLGSPSFDPLEEQAILAAFGLGSIVVAASGNDRQNGNPLEYPASLPHVLTVGATTEQSTSAFFSSSSLALDLAAPGVNMPVAVPRSFSPSGYLSGDGTSFAAPIVTGATAWVATARPDLDMTQIFELMRSSARDVGKQGWDAETGFGVIDIPTALSAPTPASDPLEPNEDVVVVKPGGLFRNGQKYLVAPARPSATLKAFLDVTEDPEDVYRILLGKRRTVTITLKPDANVTLALWGPRTRTVFERGAAQKRDLIKVSHRAGKATEVIKYRNTSGSSKLLYVDAYVPKSVTEASYTLRIVER